MMQERQYGISPNNIYVLQGIKTLSLTNDPEVTKVFEDLIKSQEIIFDDINHLTTHLSRIISKIPKSFNPYAKVHNVTNYNKASDLIMDTSEGLNLLLNGNRKSIITSGEEFPTFVYRGQAKFYDECKPNVFRINPKTGDIDLAGKLIDLTRSIIFEQALSFHPFINLINDKRILQILGGHFDGRIQCISKALYNYPFYVNRKGILQHYGFPTNLLDTTSNIKVAAFFATCEQDETTNNYKPIKYEENGVFYVIAWYHKDIFNSFDFIGWQPLSRPEEQRASSLKMSEHDNLNLMPHVFKYRFKHDLHWSKRCYGILNGENNLFAEDVMDKVANDIKNEAEFDDKHLWFAYKKLLEYFPSLKIFGYATMRDIIKRKDISIVNTVDVKSKYMSGLENQDYREHLVELMRAIKVREIII